MKSRKEKIIDQLLFWRECKEYGLSIWMCPNFLFLAMGILTIIAMVATYELSQRYTETDFVAPLVIFVAAIIFIPGSIIVQSFEKMATANKMKTEFVSIVSHQLRSPSSAIKWSLNLIMGERLGDLNEKQTEYLNLIRDNNERMIKLVNDLLNISRIEKGELVLKKEEFNLVEKIKKILSSLEPLANSNNIKLKLETDDEIPKIKGDDIYLGMVISNLIDNAIRYSNKEGEVIIKVSNSGSNKIKVTVKDEGVGIPKNEQKLIFEKFFRSRNVLKHQSEGTGLGLFIAKSVINLMGGTIGFESEEEEGTTFWFEIPTEQNKK